MSAVGEKLRIAVLASGRGSNLQALLDAAKDPAYPARIAAVFSDKKDAHALERARRAGAEARWVDPAVEDYEERLIREIEEAGASLICCAGYMRILSPKFVGHFPGKILNIHPSILPSFPGLRAQRKAIRARVRISGCTVHFIDEGVDTGPIILQAAVPVLPGDDEDSLSERILRFEHRLYPLAVRLIAEGKVFLEENQARMKNVALNDLPGFIAPPLNLA